MLQAEGLVQREVLKVLGGDVRGSDCGEFRLGRGGSSL